MNLKPNLWTLLFVLAIGGLYYTYSTNNDEASLSAPCDLDVIKEIVVLPKDSFDVRYEAYKDRYLSVMKDTSLHLDSLIGVKNLDIEYYKLVPTELEQIYCKYINEGKPDVYIYPIIQDVTADSSLIDLAIVMSDERGEKTHFDFTAPCPTLCDQ